MLPEEASDEGEVTLIEIPVSDKIAGKQVHELNLPQTSSSQPKSIMVKAKQLTAQQECISEI